MNNSVLLKWGVCVLIVSFCLVVRNESTPASQEKPIIVQSPPVEKKQQPEKSDEKLPEIFLETTEHDAGKVYEGTVATHAFIVKNKGEGELLIKSVRPG